MLHTLRKTFLIILCMLACCHASAVEYTVDGITYNVIGHKAAELVKGNNYSGDLIIPASIEYEGKQCPVTKILGNAFQNCLSLTSVIIPNSVTSIGSSTFYGCSSLASAAVSNSVTSIGEYAFYGCSSLINISLPNSLTSINRYVFQDCSSLTSVTIPNSVTSIGEYAFYNCSSLTSVTIPNSVTSIVSSAFSGCSSLASVTIPSSVKKIESYTFNGCSSLASVTIPNSVTSIGIFAFQKCSSLTSVTIPNSVTSIGGFAFHECSSLTTVTIPNSVASIGDYAFNNCEDLTDVYCYAEYLPSTGTSVFDGSHIEYTKLHVPAKSINKYKSTSPWKEFGTIVTLEDYPETQTACAMPTISYENGEITFSSETEGAQYVYTITDQDAVSNALTSATARLNAALDISVYATAAGYLPSPTAKATLYWLNASFDAITDVHALLSDRRPILASSTGGTVIIKGLEAGETVKFYAVDGKYLGETTATDSQATFDAHTSSVVIAKVADQSMKIIVR